MALWIHHPSQSMPTSFRCWAMWHISQWLDRWSRRLEFAALYPERDSINDEIPF